MRIGTGYDVHRLVEDRALILGGVNIKHQLGLLGHSDADVLVHAIMDALLGALALGDIGKHFPDTDPQYKNCDSMLLLKHVGKLVGQKGYQINNIDSTIIAQAPKLKPYISEMVSNIENCLALSPGQVSVKATTEEGLGFSGREEGIAANAVVSLLKGDLK
ncbi:2-C-methyl-D-erythritol 2,4-cyclodiphosphate synthase [Eubacteriaceae bacterium ES2]|nr:2-C-methyl-D-erythritol 2,4-cyclodiphosphate synthase [Eubacteriaceae bacterium ES2]